MWSSTHDIRRKFVENIWHFSFSMKRLHEAAKGNHPGKYVMDESADSFRKNQFIELNVRLLLLLHDNSWAFCHRKLGVMTWKIWYSVCQGLHWPKDMMIKKIVIAVNVHWERLSQENLCNCRIVEINDVRCIFSGRSSIPSQAIFPTKLISNQTSYRWATQNLTNILGELPTHKNGSTKKGFISPKTKQLCLFCQSLD